MQKPMEQIFQGKMGIDNRVDEAIKALPQLFDIYVNDPDKDISGEHVAMLKGISTTLENVYPAGTEPEEVENILFLLKKYIEEAQQRLAGQGLSVPKSRMKDVFTDFDTFDAKDKRMWRKLQKGVNKKNAPQFIKWLNEMYKGHRKPKPVKQLYDRLTNFGSSTGVKITLGAKLNLNKKSLAEIMKNISSSKEKSLRRALTVYKRLHKKTPSNDFAKIIKAIEQQIKLVGGSFKSKIKKLR